jgi:6-pyruvoyl-tetrahydropterin synthase
MVISYNHQAESIDDSIFINDKLLSKYISDINDQQEKDAINKVIELFKQARKESKLVNSEMIAENIAKTKWNDEKEMVLVSILAGAKAYNSSSEVRIVALKMISNNKSSPTRFLEEFENISKKRFKDNPLMVNITTLMTVGLIYGIFADLIDVITHPKTKKSANKFYKAVLN